MVVMMARKRRWGRGRGWKGKRVGTNVEIKMGREVRGVRGRVKKTGRWYTGGLDVCVWGGSSLQQGFIYTKHTLKSAS